MFIVALVPSVGAATIQGTIYDLELAIQDQVLLDINTTPKQQLISNGTYEFSVPTGTYQLRARQLDNGKVSASAAERITVDSDGIFVLDMILFPDLDSDLTETLGNIEQGDLIVEEPQRWWLLPIIVAVLISLFILWKKRPRKQEPDDDFGKNLLVIIKEHGGVMKQRDLRKKLAMSEAKVSIVLAELESRGKIRKIKKGRSNIIRIK